MLTFECFFICKSLKQCMSNVNRSKSVFNKFQYYDAVKKTIQYMITWPSTNTFMSNKPTTALLH